LWETVENEVVGGVVLKVFNEEIRLFIIICLAQAKLLEESSQTNQFMPRSLLQELSQLRLVIHWWSIQER